MSKLTYWEAFLVGGGAHAVATDVPGTHLVLVTSMIPPVSYRLWVPITKPYLSTRSCQGTPQAVKCCKTAERKVST